MLTAISLAVNIREGVHSETENLLDYKLSQINAETLQDCDEPRGAEVAYLGQAEFAPDSMVINTPGMGFDSTNMAQIADKPPGLA